MSNDDRERFMSATTDAVTLSDGIIITLHDDSLDGPLSAAEDAPEGTEYVGVTIEDPDTGAHDALWGIDVLPHQSGHDVREMLWDDFIAAGYSLLANARAERDHELALRADAAARDIITN